MQTPNDDIERLKQELRADLQPVTPLRSERLVFGLASAFIVVSIVVFVALYGVRADQDMLGSFLLYGPSVFEILIALVALGLAIAESLPGRAPSPALIWVAVIAGTGCHVLGSFAAWQRSPVGIPAGQALRIGLRDTGLELCIALPVVLGALWIARRGFTANTYRLGLTAGFGAAMATDGVWRLFCPVSEPGHVFTAHTPVLIAVVVLGAVLAERWRQQMSFG